MLDEAGVLARADELAGLLTDAVEHGASIGFVLPLTAAEVRDYWNGVAVQIAAGGKVLCVALDEPGSVIGAAQLGLEWRANGRHRAEVQKVMVRPAARGRGIGAALMRRIEDEARRRGRTLLFLDTSVGASGAVEFYTRLGWIPAGSIPDYAADPDGTLVPNAIFYKRLA
ncbi:MAG: GNAT family N-acetyltransferase [Opitutus sp.]|nr:GNAT family N-acetyltransferase [Opitutus sp.]